MESGEVKIARRVIVERVVGVGLEMGLLEWIGRLAKGGATGSGRWCEEGRSGD